MTVRVKFFAMCQEAVGKSEEAITLPKGSTTATLWEVLLQKYPSLAPYRTHSRLAVNLRYILSDTELQDGDEVSIIPPVSGG